MKKRTLMLFTLSAVLLVGCTSSDGSSNSNGGTGSTGGGETPSTIVTTTYTVTVYDNNGKVITTSTVSEGNTYSEPSDSFVDDQHMLRGWYLDSSLTTAASFPLTVTSDISLYPDVITNEQYYLEARERTVNSNYAYTDNLHIQAKETFFNIVTLNGYRTGEIAARPNDSFSYLAHYESSGSLLFDGEQYIMHKDGTRSNITLNEDGELTKYATFSTDEADESSVYAKAIFEYEDDDIKALTKVDTNKYQIETTLNASSVISSTLNFIGNDYVQTLIDGLPSTDSSFTMYVTYNNGYISTYTYEFDVSVGYVNCTFTYSLSFTSYDTSALVEPDLNGLYLSNSQVDTITPSLQTTISNYRNQEVSKYEYELDIALEDSSNELEANISGSATRKIDGSEIYFRNYINASTNLDDFYSDIDDGYQVTRANISDGTVYTSTKGLIFWGSFSESTSRGDVDNYYLLIDADLISSTYISAGQYLENKTTYNLVFNDKGVEYMLSLINQHVYLEEDANTYKVLGTYDISSLDISETQLKIVYSSNELSEINITMTGYIDTTVNQTSFENAEFAIQYTIEKQSISDYTVPTSSNDIEKGN